LVGMLLSAVAGFAMLPDKWWVSVIIFWPAAVALGFHRHRTKPRYFVWWRNTGAKQESLECGNPELAKRVEAAVLEAIDSH
jgi:hypothetical protein